LKIKSARENLKEEQRKKSILLELDAKLVHNLRHHKSDGAAGLAARIKYEAGRSKNSGAC
jgi:hypothetical protein